MPDCRLEQPDHTQPTAHRADGEEQRQQRRVPQRTRLDHHHFHAGVEQDEQGAERTDHGRGTDGARAVMAAIGQPAVEGGQLAAAFGQGRQLRSQAQPGVEQQADQVERDEERSPGHPRAEVRMQIEVEETSRLVQVGQQRDRGGQAADQGGQQGTTADALPGRQAPDQAGQRQEEGGGGDADQEEILHGPREPRRFTGKTQNLDWVVHVHPPWWPGRHIMSAADTPSTRPDNWSSRPI